MYIEQNNEKSFIISRPNIRNHNGIYSIWEKEYSCQYADCVIFIIKSNRRRCKESSKTQKAAFNEILPYFGCYQLGTCNVLTLG